MPLRILHLADLHLDTPFLGADAVASLSSARRDGLRQALQRALTIARERQVDAVTIAGDLYDAAFASPETVQFLIDQFHQLAPIRLFIAPGNRDPSDAHSPYALMDWSPNVHIFREPRLKSVSLDDEWLIWGMGYDHAEFSEPPLHQFQLPTAKPSILLMHGIARDLSWEPAKRVGAPFSFEEIRQAGFRLALLGHRHEAFAADQDGALVCYAGSPEPLSFAEEQEHAVWLAEWDSQRWQLESIDISRWKCRTWQLDVSAFVSPAQIVSQIHRLWNAEANGKQLLGRVILHGECAPEQRPALENFMAKLYAKIPSLRIEDRTQTTLDLDALKSELTIRGSFVRRLMANAPADEGDRALDEAALRHGLRALQGQKDLP